MRNPDKEFSEIQLVCIDLDGTLLSKNGEISEACISEFKEILNKGLEVAIVTGRPYRFARHIRNQIDRRLKIISFNGNYLDFNGKIAAYPLDQKVLEQTMEIISGSSTEAFFKSESTVICYNSDSTLFTYEENLMKTRRYVDLEMLREAIEEPLYKIFLYNEDPVVLLSQKKELAKFDNLSIISYEDIAFEILAPERHKGIAVEEMAGLLGIAKENILSIGDGENDIEMFRSSGYKVAMGNATIEIQNLADFVTDTNENEGVLKILKMLRT